MAKFYFQPKLPRPDFRLVITFLWGDFHNVDTDGDSYNPASREWTELYCKNREYDVEVFDTQPVLEEPLTLQVESARAELAARVVYFLAVETCSQIVDNLNGQWQEPEWLEDQMGHFDLAAAISRSATSCWRKSTLENPYPNLGNT